MKSFVLFLILSTGVVYGINASISKNDFSIDTEDTAVVVLDDTTNKNTKVENIKKRFKLFKKNASKTVQGETSTDPKAGLSVTEEGVEEEKASKKESKKETENKK